MCGGICGPSSEGGTYVDSRMEICVGCKRPRWMCNCLSKYSKANTKRGGIKKRVNKNRKLTKPLRSKKPVKGF